MSHIDPEREVFEAFKKLPRDVPLNMLNLVKLHDVARYEDGTETTGAEAYKTYGQESGPIFQDVGGKIIWRGEPQLMLIGPEAETWDIAFVAYYPNAGAFMEMVTNPDYRIAVKHRQAAVLDSRLLRCHEVDGSSTFG